MDTIYMGLVFVSIQPVCVSVGPFYPFIGKVIIAMHDTIIYFIILFFFHVYSLPSISCLESIL